MIANNILPYPRMAVSEFLIANGACFRQWHRDRSNEGVNMNEQ